MSFARSFQVRGEHIEAPAALKTQLTRETVVKSITALSEGVLGQKLRLRFGDRTVLEADLGVFQLMKGYKVSVHDAVFSREDVLTIETDCGAVVFLFGVERVE